MCFNIWVLACSAVFGGWEHGEWGRGELGGPVAMGVHPELDSEPRLSASLQ